MKGKNIKTHLKSKNKEKNKWDFRKQKENRYG